MTWSFRLGAAAMLLGAAATSPAHAAWTLAPLDGNSLGAMYPIAIDNGSGVTGDLFPSGNKPVLYSYATMSALWVWSLCGGNGTAPSAVDRSGFYVVGTCYPNGPGSLYGFLHVVNGPTTAIAYPGAQSTFPAGVVSGTVAGSFFLPGYVELGFLYNIANQTYSAFGFPGASQTEVQGMSPSGVVFGDYSDAAGDHGYLYQNGKFTVLGTPPGYVSAYPMAVNGSNQVVGLLVDPSSATHAFSWKSGVYTVWPAPFASNAFAMAITADGRVAGYVQTTSNTYYGYVWSPSLNTASFFVPPSGTAYMQVTAINDWGQVAGYYQNGSTATGFIGTCSGTGCVP